MIDMAMSVDEFFYAQFFVLDKLDQFSFFFFLNASGINNHTFVCFVKQYIGVFHEGIECKFFDLQHNKKSESKNKLDFCHLTLLRLNSQATFDYIIVGQGLAGSCVALQLLKH